MANMRVYLVVGADRSVRVGKRPRVQPDEVAVAIDIEFPGTWGRIVETVNITMPDAPRVDVGQPNGEGGS